MSRENMILLLSGRMRRQLLYELFNNFAFQKLELHITMENRTITELIQITAKLNNQ